MDREFLLVADALWLDFVNTARIASHPERLNDLAAWHRFTQACRLPSDHPLPDFRALRRLRGVLSQVAAALADGLPIPGGAVDSVNGLLAAVAGRERLVRENGRWRLRFAPIASAPALVAVARSIAVTLTDATAAVRRCANPACLLFFLDRTAAGTRRYCSEFTCAQGRWTERRRGVLA